ncbi:MAG TPA: glucose-6-phosphate dehydrogenase [Candidatus Nanoarchaeia archaeon]|nr:glucose-6-phosphate dehydrogenase [Candidatus Nanoarchaeia archaeon]
MKMKECSCIFTIFGATGDLTNRKLLPAFYFLEQERQLKENFRIICIARKKITNAQYRKGAANSIKKFSRINVKDEILRKVLSRIIYHRINFTALDGYSSLKSKIESLSGDKCAHCERIFYLAVPSGLIGTIIGNIKSAGLAERQSPGKPYNRIMFEKPFGSDLESAKKLNKYIRKVFDEKQVYRIDHYMAKELVQNLLVLRFANSIFEPLWNKMYIDHIQVTVAETLGVENRGDYYDKAGALRDVIQNHMMQLLSLVGMAAPKTMNADDVKNEKVKVLKSIPKLKYLSKDIIIGQYTGGVVENKKVISYRNEPEVDKYSCTETYVALKLEIFNEMWKGVPFYLRTGKRLKDKSTEIAIVYRHVPFGLFSKSNPEKNMMIIRVQPYEGITLQFNAKVPGNKVIIDNVEMDFCHECKFGPNSPEAYERLLYDVMIGDQTLFTRWDEVENSWKLIDAVLKNIKNLKLKMYNAGTWGPKEADKLIERDGRKWVEPKRPAYADQLEK